MKMKKKAKLLWVCLHPSHKNKFESALLTYSGNSIKVIKKYMKSDLVFTYNLQNEKGYIINPI